MPRRSFAACRSRSPAAPIVGLSATGEIIVFGRVAVSPWLNEDIGHHAFLIHRAPKIVLNSADPDEYLIEVPLISRSRTTAAQAFGEVLAEFLAPAFVCQT